MNQTRKSWLFKLHNWYSSGSRWMKKKKGSVLEIVRLLIPLLTGFLILQHLPKKIALFTCLSPVAFWAVQVIPIREDCAHQVPQLLPSCPSCIRQIQEVQCLFVHFPDIHVGIFCVITSSLFEMQTGCADIISSGCYCYILIICPGHYISKVSYKSVVITFSGKKVQTNKVVSSKWEHALGIQKNAGKFGMRVEVWVKFVKTYRSRTLT